MPLLTSLHVVQIGCGNMGLALLKGFLAKGEDSSSFSVIDPMAAASVSESTGVSSYSSLEYAVKAGVKADILLVAIKPQMFDQLSRYRSLCHEKTLIISVAAGKTLRDISDSFTPSQPIIRAMPNLPSMVSMGMTGSIANEAVDKEQRKINEGLFECVGSHVWLESEKQMHALTAVSGSGPGYIFHVIEALAHAGEAAGLSPELSLTLAKQTVAGTAHMADISDQTPAQLRKAVTSPAGTTEAGLNVLMDEAAGLNNIFTNAVNAAAHRSKTLAGEA